jgi:hypothetical protein
MCPPAASSASFRKLGPIVPSSVWQVVSLCELPVASVGRTHLVVIDCTTSLDGGCRLWIGESPGQWQQQRRWRGRLWGEGAFGSFRHLAGKGALTAAVAPVTFGHVRVIDRAVVPVIWVPLRQNAVGVMTVDMRSRAPLAPVSHSQAVETKPFHSCICTHHVAWTTPSDDNCRWAVDGT